MNIAIFLLLLLIPINAFSITFSGVTLKDVATSSSVNTSTTFTVDSSFFYDNGYNVAQSGYIQTSTQARATFSTTASSITVGMYNNGMYTNYGSNGYCSVGVLVNGVDQGQIVCTKSGAETQTFSLGAVGSKTVELRNGLIENRVESGNIFGTFLTSVTFDNDGNAIKTTPAPTKRIVIYGDSISCGAADTQANLTGWPMRLRDYYGPTGSVMSEAVGSQALHYDTSTNGTPTSTGNRLAGYFSGYSTKILYIAHGRNDYGGTGWWSAANFGTAYASMLDAIHAADPAIIIYAQTPIVQAVESANSFGNTLPNYRTQVTNACNARSSYCTVVDGAAIVTTSDLADGIHPKASAQSTYFNAVKTALGI